MSTQTSALLCAENITVCASKTPEKIAADICKRIMANAEKMQGLLAAHIARGAH